MKIEESNRSATFKNTEEMIASKTRLDLIMAIVLGKISVEQISPWLVLALICAAGFILGEAFESVFLIIFVLCVATALFLALASRLKGHRRLADAMVITAHEILIFTKVVIHPANSRVSFSRLYRFGRNEVREKFDFSELMEWIPSFESLPKTVAEMAGAAAKRTIEKRFKTKFFVDRHGTITFRSRLSARKGYDSLAITSKVISMPEAVVKFLNSLEQQRYEQAACEVAEGNVITTVMDKASADAKGDNDRAHSLYLKYRVESLKAEQAEFASRRRNCPECGASYRPADYRPDAVWYCGSCNAILPHEL